VLNYREPTWGKGSSGLAAVIGMTDRHGIRAKRGLVMGGGYRFFMLIIN